MEPSGKVKQSGKVFLWFLNCVLNFNIYPCIIHAAILYNNDTQDIFKKSSRNTA